MDYNELYIGGALPISFTDKENEEYFLKVQNGDVSAKDEIKEHNLRLVQSIINRKFYNVKEIDKTELFSIGTFALNKAVDTFNTDKGTKFSTYAGRVIENEIRMALRKLKHSKNEVSLEEVVYNGKDGDEITLKNMIPSDDDLEEKYLNEELIKGVRYSLNILTEIEREVVELAFGFRGNVYKQREIAEILGISQSYICRIETNATKKISEYLISRGLIERSGERLEKSPTSETIALTYAREIINNVTLDELSLKTGKSIYSIKYLITRKLPLLDNDLYIKIKGILEMKGKKEVKNDKNLFSLFTNYSEEEINKALEKLESKEREILLLRYPINGEESKTVSFVAQKYDIKPGSISAKINGIIKKVNKALEENNISKEESLFEYFKEYTKEQVIEAISTLKDDSKNIIELKYGLNGKSVTSTKDIAKLYNANGNAMSGRIYAIRKSIQTRLEKINKKEEKQINSLELAQSKVEQIKSTILDGTFNEEQMVYNINDIKIEIQKVETNCLITTLDKKYNKLDGVHSVNKKCFVYVIRISNLNGDLLFENILVQDRKTRKFYPFINKYEDGEFNLDGINPGVFVCYDTFDIHAMRLKKEKSNIETKPVVNVPKIIEQPKEISKYTPQEEKQAEFYFELGVKLFNKRQFVKARKEFLKALASGQTYTLQKTNYYLGRIELAKNKTFIAESYLNVSLEYNDKDYYTLLELGKALSLQGRYEEANVYFEKCYRLKPKCTDSIIEQAKNLTRQKQYEEALKYYDKAIGIKQNNYLAYLNKGELLFELKRYEEAKKVLTMCGKLKKDKKQHNLILGKINYLENNQEKAKEIFEEILKDKNDKNYLICLNNIGFFYHNLGEKELAYEYYLRYPVYQKWFNLSEKTVIEHIYKHMSNSDNEKMHSVFNFPISINLFNNLIKDMDKTSAQPLYDIYQIHCENAGYMVIDKEIKEREDYIIIKTLPFTKKVMLAFPDHKLPDVEVTKSVSLEDLLNFGKKVEEPVTEPKQVEIVEEKDVTVVTETQNIVNSNFEECRNQVRMFINMLIDPTEQVVLFLRLGYVRNKNYTESEISKFLNISEEEVKTIINKSLSNLSLISTNTLNFLKETEKTYELK